MSEIKIQYCFPWGAVAANTEHNYFAAVENNGKSSIIKQTLFANLVFKMYKEEPKFSAKKNSINSCSKKSNSCSRGMSIRSIFKKSI